MVGIGADTGREVFFSFVLCGGSRKQSSVKCSEQIKYLMRLFRDLSSKSKRSAAIAHAVALEI